MDVACREFGTTEALIPTMLDAVTKVAGVTSIEAADELVTFSSATFASVILLNFFVRKH